MEMGEWICPVCGAEFDEKPEYCICGYPAWFQGVNDDPGDEGDDF